MKKFELKTHYKKILADTISPVSVYLKIRDKFPNSILLESSDYHGNDNSFSYICCNPIASIKRFNSKNKQYSLFSNGYIQVNPFKGFVIRSQGSYELNSTISDNFNPNFIISSIS